MGAFIALGLVAQPAVAQDWSGPYAGVNIGAAAPSVENEWNSNIFCSTEGLADNCGEPVNDLNSAGILFGAVGGVNWQRGQYVFGVEADVASTSIKNDSYYKANDGAVTGSERAGLNIDMLASVRGRAGMAFGENLVYASAGIGFMAGDFTASTSDTDPFMGIKSISNVTPVLGLGYQRYVSENVSLDVSAQHYFGSDRIELGGGFGDGDTTDSTLEITGLTTISIGLRFDF